MRRGFSLTNLLIVIGLIALAFLGYREYKKSLIIKDNTRANQAGQSSENTHLPAESGVKQPATDPLKNQTGATYYPINQAPENQNAAQSKPAAVKPATEQNNGFYENTTYHYSLKIPPAWPIKVRSQANISFGTVPPKDGQGAITIEITAGENNNEVAQAKAEAAKYPGFVSLTEEPLTLAGVTGTKITLNNFMAKVKNIYMLLIKNDLNYIIKYSEESAEFSEEAKQALSTFKFTK